MLAVPCECRRDLPFQLPGRSLDISRGDPRALKGQDIYAFVIQVRGLIPWKERRDELLQYMQEHRDRIAKLDHVKFTEALPKIRSGKIMRQIIC